MIASETKKNAPSVQLKKVAVVLSGCGYMDGSEITEAISALIALSEAGAEATCFAPNINFKAISHYGNDKTENHRNVLVEAARIARGKIHDLSDLIEKNFDAIVFPGGFGAAKNLSSWATDGSNGQINADIMRIIIAFHRAAKPIGAICIAPALVAMALGNRIGKKTELPPVSASVSLTVGDDIETAKEIEKTGAHHIKCPVTDYVSDRDNKVLTTPAYMYDAKPHEVFTGIRKMIRELVEMA